MKWDNIDLTTKIRYLELLMNNASTGTFDKQDVYIVKALVTGSMNKYANDDLRFDVTSNHVGFLKRAWEMAITNQKNDDVIYKIKSDYTLTDILNF
tara:strand:+ start:128 stop:415 length:288 start_codon:yes stop_codon:yes gene_type:complete